MHYYQFNIGDYRRDTAHLSHLEHGIYRSLIDTYMLEESPLSGDMKELERKHLIRTANEKKALRNVLKDFFKFENSMFLHCRCDEDIISYRDKSLKASKSAKKRWEKDANAVRTHSEGNANHKPKNHKPIPNNQSIVPAKAGKKKTSLSDDFILTTGRAGLAIKYWDGKGRTDLDVREIFDQFVTYCKANGKTYAEWESAWQTWYVNAVKFERSKQNGTGQQFGQKTLSKSERRDAQARAYLDENNDDGVAWPASNEVSP